MKWFKVQALAENPRAAHVVIDKPIGSDWAPDWIKELTNEQAASEFIAAVESLGELDEIDLEINCPGGDVASGIRIFNYLRGHRATIHVRVTGQAASIATVIMMVGDTRTMAIGTTIMVHRASSLMLGFYTAAEMREFAGNIDVIDAAVVEAYTATTGRSEMEIATLLDQGDTFMGAGEAIEWGFATGRDDQVQAVASADTAIYMQQLARAGGYRSETKQFSGGQIPPDTRTPIQLIAAALDLEAGVDLSADAAPALDVIQSLKSAPTAESLRQQHPDMVAGIENAARAGIDVPGERQAATAAERERIQHVLQTCRTFGQPQLVDKLIDNGSTSQAISDYVSDVASAGSDRNHINGSHSPEGGQHQAGIDPGAIYARRSRRGATTE